MINQNYVIDLIFLMFCQNIANIVLSNTALLVAVTNDNSCILDIMGLNEELWQGRLPHSSS